MLFRLYTPVYALTLLFSAALLFSVQPMFSKLILPLLGGTPQVWNTAMLFFQVCLLGGYAYAHGTSRYLSMRAQAITQVVILSVFTMALPLAIPAGWSPPADKDPTLWQLSLMTMTVGGPFFFLAGSAPMLQRWFSLSRHKDAANPYFLYGASNLGSMTALFAYPVLIEPMLTLSDQADVWMFGYFTLICLTTISAALIWRSSEAATKPVAHEAASVVTPRQRLQWIALSFIPSSLMLGVTTYITTDIATVPLLWILPLALYVGTFILVFARNPLLSEDRISTLFALSLMAVVCTKIAFNYSTLNPMLLVGLHITAFFFASYYCHTALVKAKPAPDRLTEFYLYMSIGGALGGFFNAIIAPQFLFIPIEYGLMLAIAAFMRFTHTQEQSASSTLNRLKERIKLKGLDFIFQPALFCIYGVFVLAIFNFNISQRTLAYFSVTIIAICLLIVMKKRWIFAGLITFLLAMFPLGFYWGQNAFTHLIYQDRNFFGVIKVVDTVNNERALLHGTTNHGTQTLDPKHRLEPLSYYGGEGPINDPISYYDRKAGEQKVGVIGLGIGVVNCYAKAGRHYDFFEIDPEIAAVAENKDFFTFLSDCNSPYDIILGDGRLKLAEKPEGYYDFIILDAFSSDNIPAHVLTTEAIDIYLKRLKPDGVIIMNISNNYLDLEPVVAKNAQVLGVYSLGKIHNGGKIKGTEIKYYPSHWMVVTKSDDVVKYLEKMDWSAGIIKEDMQAWTDQYSNILSVLGNETGAIRYKKWKERHAQE